MSRIFLLYVLYKGFFFFFNLCARTYVSSEHRRKVKYSLPSISLLFYFQAQNVDLILKNYIIVYWAMLLDDSNSFLLQQQNKASLVSDHGNIITITLILLRTKWGLLILIINKTCTTALCFATQKISYVYPKMVWK